jgi:hypothetical protein
VFGEITRVLETKADLSSDKMQLLKAEAHKPEASLGQ